MRYLTMQEHILDDQMAQLTDETQMEIDNLTELREGFYARALGGPDPRKKNELPAPDQEAEPPGQDSPGEDKEEL